MKCANRVCGKEIDKDQPFFTNGTDDFCDDVCAAFEAAYRLEDQKGLYKKLKIEIAE